MQRRTNGPGSGMVVALALCAVLMPAPQVAAQTTPPPNAGTTASEAQMRGQITFDGGAPIPKGELKVNLQTQGAKAERKDGPDVSLDSDGGQTAIAFAVPDAASADMQPGTRIEVRLERADGWLLARGSATVKQGEPVDVKLSTVVY